MWLILFKVIMIKSQASSQARQGFHARTPYEFSIRLTFSIPPGGGLQGETSRFSTRPRDRVQNGEIWRYTSWANFPCQNQYQFCRSSTSQKAMQADDGEEVSPPSSPTAPSGCERCAACPVLIPQDWPLRFWLSRSGLPATEAAASTWGEKKWVFSLVESCSKWGSLSFFLSWVSKTRPITRLSGWWTSD